jgi:hypothetical protein
MVPGKLFIKDGFQDGAPCPGQIKGNRKMANKLPDPYYLYSLFYYFFKVKMRIAANNQMRLKNIQIYIIIMVS